MHHTRHPQKAALRNLVREALTEDIGSGDTTTLAVVPPDQGTLAEIRTRQDCVVAGLPLAELVFAELDREVTVTCKVADGARCSAGDVIATVAGKAQAILSGERTALNFLQRLSGIATLTHSHVQALGNGTTRLLDTRKTTPGWRQLEKYAVACGGGENHRFGLYDRVMIKDNHRVIANLQGPGGIRRAVDDCRRKYPFLEIEVEVDTLQQLEEALNAKADYVLLDNMTNEELAEAVLLRDSHGPTSRLEASGNMTLERLPAVAETGVDFVSVGALTHSAPAVDIGLDLNNESPGYPFA